ncbi:MAG TPA: septum site-determining protein MinC, partial [Orrella sp.]
PVVQAATQTPIEPVAETAATPPAASGSPTLVIEGPLRSGQRVYARDADLIVMGVVSQGAEVIADGNIHVYGPLRGKAMAGARGDAQARIFTTRLDAELVAVAGVYRVIDATLPANLHRKPAMVFLKDQALRLEPLGD